MRKLLLETLQKDIEVFRYSMKKTIENGRDELIFSNYDFELSSIKLVSRILKKQVSDAFFDEAIEISVSKKTSPKQAAETILIGIEGFAKNPSFTIA